MAADASVEASAPGRGRGRGTFAALLPREHGTWAMLGVPWAVGVGVAGGFGGADLLLLAALLAAFLAHVQVMQWARLGLALRPDPAALLQARRLAALLGAAAALAASPLLLTHRRVALLAFAGLGVALTAAGVALVRARRDRALAGQVLAALSLSLAAPAAYYVGRATVDARAVALWSVCALFFLGAVLYVRLKIAALARRGAAWPIGERLRFAAPTLVLDAGCLGAAAVALHAGGFSPAALAAFGPTAAQTVAGVLTLHRPARLKRVGLLATFHAIAFAALLIGLA